MPATDRTGIEGSEDAGPEPRTLDLRGLRCPLPVLKTARHLAALRPGERLAVLSDDPLAALDLPAFCAQEGQGVVVQGRDAGVYRLVVERGANAPSLTTD